MEHLLEFWPQLGAVAGATSALLSFAALVVSIIALRRSGPRITVSLYTAIAVSDEHSKWHGRSVAIIDVSNDGARPIQLQSIELHSRVGSVLGETVKNVPSPHTLEAQGGRRQWFTLRDELRSVARRDGGEEQVEFRAVVKSGRRNYRSRETVIVHPLEPEYVAKHKHRMRDRVHNFVASWLTPSIQATGFTDLADIDLGAGCTVVVIKNFGGGLASGATLELMEEVRGERRRVGTPIEIPSLWRGQTARLNVPLVDRDDLTWWIRHKGRIRTGTGAMTCA